MVSFKSLYYGNLKRNCPEILASVLRLDYCKYMEPKRRGYSYDIKHCELLLWFLKQNYGFSKKIVFLLKNMIIVVIWDQEEGNRGYSVMKCRIVNN